MLTVYIPDGRRCGLGSIHGHDAAPARKHDAVGASRICRRFDNDGRRLHVTRTEDGAAPHLCPRCRLAPPKICVGNADLAECADVAVLLFSPRDGDGQGVDSVSDQKLEMPGSSNRSKGDRRRGGPTTHPCDKDLSIWALHR
jgi:hypothetical protein